MTIANLLSLLEDTVSGRDDHTDQMASLARESKKAWKRAEKRISRARDRGQEELGTLGKIRITVMAIHMKAFLDEFTALRHVEMGDCKGLVPFSDPPMDLKYLKELVQIYEQANSGLLAGYNASEASAFRFGSGTLSRYARTPEFHFDESTFTGSKDALQKADEEIRTYGAKVTEICEHLQDIRRIAREAEDALLDLSDMLDDCTEDIREIREAHGNDWKNFTKADKLFIARAVQVAGLIQNLADFHILTEEAHLKDSVREALQAAKEAIHEMGA